MTSRSSDGDEFLHVDGTNCSCNQDLYVAVHSYRGSGSFMLIQHKHYASKHYTTAKAVINCNLPFEDVELRAKRLANGFRYFFGAMEGTRYWDRLELHDNSGGDEMIKWRCYSGTANAGICNGDIELYDEEATWIHGYKVIAHELGHFVGCLEDEYLNTGSPALDQSLMAGYFTNNDFCYCESGCPLNGGNHGRDPVPPGTYQVPPSSAWQSLQSTTPYPVLAENMDNSTYFDYDFEGLYAELHVYHE